MSNEDKNKVSIEIKLSEDHLMNMISGVITPYISTKIKNCVETNTNINVSNTEEYLLKNIYIESKLRLSTTLNLEDTLSKMRTYYKDTEDDILIQKVIIQMMNQLPDGYTIIETGICKDSSNIKYIYAFFLDKEIVSFIFRNKELVENVYFSTNFYDNDDGLFLYQNKIFISELENKYNNVIPNTMKEYNVLQKFGGDVIPSLTN